MKLARITTTVLTLLLLSVPASGGDLDQIIPDLFGQVNTGFVAVVTIEGGGNPGTFISDAGAGLSGSFNPSGALGGLNSQIASQFQKTPLGSTVAAFTFEFDPTLNVVERSTEGLGPLLSERADTTGKGQLNVAFAVTHVDFDVFEGEDIDDIPVQLGGTNPSNLSPGNAAYLGGAGLANPTSSFSLGGGASIPFTDGGGGVWNGNGITGVHNAPFTSGSLSLQDPVTRLDLNVEVDAFALFLNYGVTERIDVGVVIPVLRVDVDAAVEVSGLRDGATGAAQSVRRVSESDSSTGLGDVIVRAKARVLETEWFDLAVRGDLTLPTGDEDNFRGFGDPALGGMVILSKDFGRFEVHSNAAFSYRVNEHTESSFRYNIGASWAVHERVTLSVDFLESRKFNDNGIGDKLTSAATGIKFNPFDRFVVSLNALWRLNDEGLRADVIPTVAVEYTF